MHHEIFSEFDRVSSIGTGTLWFDFIGAGVRGAFKRGWERHVQPKGRVVKPEFPAVNEHYFDWIATLTAVKKSSGTFRMAELGAGYAPWLVRAALAARQRSEINKVELVAVEADPTHWDWVNIHFSDNGLDPSAYHILKGAVSDKGGYLKFPLIEDPDVDYGASLRAVTGDRAYIEVKAYSIQEILDLFSGPVDFMHVDIQGAEYDSLPPVMDVLKKRVKSIMVGTHIENQRHDWLSAQFQKGCWREVMNFPRQGLVQTEFGKVQFGDGFLLYENPDLN